MMKEAMPEPLRTPDNAPLDYDPEVAEQIQHLLEQLEATQDPQERSRIKNQLAAFVFAS